MLVHQSLARSVMSQTASPLLGLLGDGNLFFADSFVQQGGSFVPFTHEANALLAAAGFSRITGDVGLATVTHGPGVTNLATALVETVRARAQVVVVAGDTSGVAKDGLQDIDQRNLARFAGAGFEKVRAAATLSEDVATAFRRARWERRPILLDCPVDLMWCEASYEQRITSAGTTQVVPTDEQLDLAVGMLLSARLPVVLVGAGLRNDPTAQAAVLSLARLLDAPLATTLKGRDLYAGDNQSIGICGSISDEYVMGVLGQSDCVIAFGAALTRWTTADGALLRGKGTIHVDSDPMMLGAHWESDVQVLGDAGATARAIERLLRVAEVEPTRFHGKLPTRSEREFPKLTRDGTLDIRFVFTRLNSELPPDRHVTIDCGRFFFHAAPMLGCGSGGSYQHALEFGSVGLGLGTALGAAIADPAIPSVLVVGDGGLMLTGLAELTTAVTAGLDLIVVVVNDSAYGAEYVQLVDRGMDPRISVFNWPDFAETARALGLNAYTVKTPDDLEGALTSIRVRPSPVLLDIHLSPTGMVSGAH